MLYVSNVAYFKLVWCAYKYIFILKLLYLLHILFLVCININRLNRVNYIYVINLIVTVFINKLDNLR